MNYHNLARCLSYMAEHQVNFIQTIFFTAPSLSTPPFPPFQPHQPFSKKPSNEGFSLMNERHPYLGMQTQLYYAWYTRRGDSTASRHFGMSAHTEPSTSIRVDKPLYGHHSFMA